MEEVYLRELCVFVGEMLWVEKQLKEGEVRNVQYLRRDNTRQNKSLQVSLDSFSDWFGQTNHFSKVILTLTKNALQ